MSHDLSLEPRLREVEPAVRLIPERHLRQVLHYLNDRRHDLPINLTLPYWVSRDELSASRVLSPSVLDGTEQQLLLITDPDDRMIGGWPPEVCLREYWRVLVRAAVLREIDRKIAAGELNESLCLERLEQFGLAEAREIRSVLIAEHLATPGADAVTRYRTFAAIYADLSAFDPRALPNYFPTLPGGDVVRRLLSADIDLDLVVARSRPQGAADAMLVAADSATSQASLPPVEPQRFRDQAHEAEGKGNHVRAAILLTAIATRTDGADREAARGEARRLLAGLVESLGGVFAWSEERKGEWRAGLEPLLEPAARGVWPRAARCLYELQKIPADLSRDVYAVDLPEAIRTFGRRPVKRLLPHARIVLVLMSIRKANTQMRRAGLPLEAQLRLDHLFHEQIHQVEHDVRREFTPIIAASLAAAGLVPANTVEKVARDKIVAELLDRICERGYLRIGNLRDAIARNRLKINDLTGPAEWLRGDALLRADLALAESLDGVYRKGEFYLRWIQRSSALFFGTPFGRLFTLYIALPFGGAFMVLMFLEELRHIGGKVASLVSKPAATVRMSPKPMPVPDSAAQAPDSRHHITPDELDVDDEGQVVWVNLKPGTVTSDLIDVDDEGNPFLFGTEPGAALVTDVFTSSAPADAQVEEHHASVLIAWPTIVGFGVFLLLMFHVPPARRAAFALAYYCWKLLRALFWDIPRGVWRCRLVRAIRQSLPVRFLVHHFWSPLLITFLLFAALLFAGVSPWFLLRWGLWIWAALTIAYNTPWGWVVQDRIAETVSDWWRLVRVNLIPGLIATIIDWFKMLANWIERQLYAVDEWFRFRGGDSQGSLAVKAVLGLVWFPIAYVFRFVFYLLVEPQVNPVKHFPVVTVSHKVIWPMVPQLVDLTGLSVWTVSSVINGIPGIFGFIAWELKENWRLYGANRAARLRPVTIGSHGESMRGLLRPGFHSGTIPKHFRKLRHANPARALRLQHDLDHTAEGVRWFVERELIDLLSCSADWGRLPIEVAAIRFGVQRIVIEFAAPSLDLARFALAFENVHGVIEASIEEIGWADKLTRSQQEVFVAALRGLLDMAAVERIGGRARFEGDEAVGPGLEDLARRVRLTEWVERWDGAAGAAPPSPQNSNPGTHSAGSNL